MKIDIVAFAELAYDAASIEDAGQLASDGLLLKEVSDDVENKHAQSYTIQQVTAAIEAAARTLAVAVQLCKTHPQDVIKTWKDVLS